MAIKNFDMKAVNIHEKEFSKELDDFYKFFTDPSGFDVLSYAYRMPNRNYEKLVEDNPLYYLFNQEKEIIKNNINELSNLLSDVNDIIEIGPGAAKVLESKTIPIINCAKNLQKYSMVDISASYLSGCKKFLEKQKRNIKIETVIFDLLGERDLKVKTSNIFSKKAILFLGSTLCNFRYEEQLRILSHISKMMKPNDLAMISIDTNQDENSLMEAYANEYASNFFMDILNYFCQINSDFSYCLDKIEPVVRWNKDKNFVDLYFLVKEDISFYMEKYGDIFLEKGRELHGVISQKPTKSYIDNLLKNSGLVEFNMLGSDHGMGIYICKKMAC